MTAPHNDRCASLLGQGCDCRSPWADEVTGSAARVLAVIKKPHDDLGEDGFHQWITLDERIKADRNGRVNPRIFGLGDWVKWICNNTDCTAWALVSDASGLLAIEEAESG